MAEPKFIQVEREIVRAIKELGAPSAAVYLVLCDHCWGKFAEKWWSWPTVKTICTETGYKRSTVFVALRVLREKKWIKHGGFHTNGAVKWILLRRSPEWRGVQDPGLTPKEGVHSNEPGSSTVMDSGVHANGHKSDLSQTKKQNSSTNSGEKGTEAEPERQFGDSSPDEADAAEVAEAGARWRDTHRDAYTPSQTANWDWRRG